jgi:Flp pilus assembly protein TadD
MNPTTQRESTAPSLTLPIIAPEAENSALAALEANPADDKALHTLGLARYAAGQAQEALDLISKASESNPSNADYCISLGRILTREKMFNPRTR